MRNGKGEKQKVSEGHPSPCCCCRRVASAARRTVPILSCFCGDVMNACKPGPITQAKRTWVERASELQRRRIQSGLDSGRRHPLKGQLNFSSHAWDARKRPMEGCTYVAQKATGGHLICLANRPDERFSASLSPARSIASGGCII